MRLITAIRNQLEKKYELTITKSIRNFQSFRSGNKQSFKQVQLNSTPKIYGKLWKPFGFTILFSGTSIIGAAIWEYERVRAHTLKAINFFRPSRIQRTGWRREVEIWWNRLSDGEKLFAPICFLNVLVFLAWRVPTFQSSMARYFYSGQNYNSLSMVLSTFSHQSLLHLAANMFVLYTYSTPVVSVLGKEQFVAFYLTSGVVSNFASLLFRTATGSLSLSLGASGAILGIIGFFCMQNPDGRISLIFLPMYSIPAIMALKAVMSVDLAGCLFGWKVFDHAAHLGGALIGIFWHEWGNANIWRKREPIIQLWDKIRN